MHAVGINPNSVIVRARLVMFTALLLTCVWPVRAGAHGVRLPFDKWGGFSRGTVRCQRALARAAAQCASSAWTVQRGCERAELAGESCDHTSTDATVAAIRIKALDAVDKYCSEHQFIDLQYLGLFDAQADVIKFCRDSETALVSAVYGPVQGSTPSAAVRGCVEAAANAADGILQFMLRNRRQCMDRIAAMPLAAPNRLGVLDSAARRTSQAQAGAVARLAAGCAAGQFNAVYGRSPSAFVDGVSARADCVGAQFYIQDAVLCPAAVCGNGIIEPGEDCDDGNTADGDACAANCL
jgi:cysteine-rich repeat protein